MAAGSASLNEDGTFKIEFTPEADERTAANSRDVTYRYRISADVTDEGGETRSASRSFRLGFVSVEARIDGRVEFLPGGNSGRFHDYPDRSERGSQARGPGRGGSSRSGSRRRLCRLPTCPLREPEAAGQKAYRTPGDALRPRWDTQYAFRAVLHDWADGAERARGAVTHDSRGEARMSTPALPAGPYRLHYDTVDDFGAVYRRSEEFIVAGARTQLALPAVLLVEKSSQPVGGTARFLALSGLPDQLLFFEVWRDGRLAERRRAPFGPGRDGDRTSGHRAATGAVSAFGWRCCGTTSSCSSRTPCTCRGTTRP